MTELKLAKLPDGTPIKVTLSITPALNSALAAYQALYREVYGVEAPLYERYFVQRCDLASCSHGNRSAPFEK